MVLLTVSEVAQRLRVSASLVYRLVRQGLLPVVRVGLGQGRVRVLADDLDRYVSEHRETPEQSAQDTRPPPVRLRHVRVRA